jgi:hypothetical protein
MQRVQAIPERLIGVRREVAVAVEGEADRGVLAPAAIHSATAVCRRSWMRSPSSPAALVAGRQMRCRNPASRNVPPLRTHGHQVVGGPRTGQLASRSWPWARRNLAPSIGWKSEPGQRRGVADVVQERGGDQQVGILRRQEHGHPTRLVGDGLDVQPPVAQRCDQPFCLRLCLRFQGHSATIPCVLDRAQAVLLAA